MLGTLLLGWMNVSFFSDWKLGTLLVSTSLHRESDIFFFKGHFEGQSCRQIYES